MVLELNKTKPKEKDRIPDLDTWVFNYPTRKSLTKKEMSRNEFHKHHTAFADDGRRFRNQVIFNSPMMFQISQWIITTNHDENQHAKNSPRQIR